MNRLDSNILKQIAEMICGTDGNGPVYREGWKLPEFFSNAGWTDVPRFEGAPGYGRDRWTYDLLLERRDDPESIAQVIRRLADPREYSPDQALPYKARDQLNSFLHVEGLSIDLVDGRPEIAEGVPTCEPPPPKAPEVLRADIADIVQDPKLAELLQQRLDEALRCQKCDAHLSAVIMLGGVLEGVLVDFARNKMAQACQAISPPRNHEGQLPVEEWKLNHLIEVAHKCGWIELDVKRFSHELREYRNMVHASGELKDGHHPTGGTVTLCWDVVVLALNQLAP